MIVRQIERSATISRLAHAVKLDMVEASWRPDSYLGRVTKSRILEAVREAKGDSNHAPNHPAYPGNLLFLVDASCLSHIVAS
ncbi:hypothetical protein IP86_14635 [Rhodopseudomonas sp. AAP120]|nr:hypothetical protein IP86_14635 [Rhodopseudomonas sp. AAP120]